MAVEQNLKTAVAGVLAVLLASLLAACSTDAYDAGDGSLSYMRADFVMARTGSDGKFCSAATDDGATLNLSPALAAGWTSKPDTVYRALLYYSCEGAVDKGATLQVRPVSIVNVLVPKVADASHGQTALPVDPVTLETAWKSASGDYLNLGIAVKTGSVDGKFEAQSIGLAYTGSTTLDGGSKRYRLQLLHSQNNVPQYYSASVYVSVPLRSLPVELQQGDQLEITVPTYKGEAVRLFTVD